MEFGKKLFESQNLMDYFKINKDKIIMIIKKVIIIIIIIKDKINEIKIEKEMKINIVKIIGNK